nr:RNA polymerase sigma-I factor [Aneurinibacillus terranovensis]
MLLTLFPGKKQRISQPLPNNEIELLHHMIEKIQQGEDDLRNDILEKYRPFIAKTVSSVCKRYISQSYDEEFGIGLEAFNEAITVYTSSKGSSFLSFADLVIRRRIIDYIRKNKQKISAVSFDDVFNDRGPDYNVWETQISMAQYQTECEAEYRREEILHYKERLLDFHILLEELPDCTPKHSDARVNMVEIAHIIAEQPELRESLLKKKKIPVKKLLQFINFSRKTIERNRNYIVAITLIFIEDYRYLRSYIRLEETKGKEGDIDDQERNRIGSEKGISHRNHTERGIL